MTGMDLTAPDMELRRAARVFEERYGCTYSEFVNRGSFEERRGREWLDEMAWRLILDELADRARASWMPLRLPYQFIVPSEA